MKKISLLHNLKGSDLLICTELEDTSFWGCDFPVQLQNFIKEHKSQFTEGMSEDEIKAYDLALSHVDTTLEFLCSLDEEEKDIVFYKKGCTTTEQFTISDIVKIYGEDD